MDIAKLIDAPRPVVGAPGIVYSTKPQIAVTDRGKCILKNHNREVVFAEAVCYSLANAVGLDVPEGFLCLDDSNGSMLFASAEMRFRFPIDVLARGGLICNPHTLSHTTVFDVWVCNIDRNVGNFVAAPPIDGSARFKVFAIDFEKSQVCRGVGSLVLAGIDPRKCWPSEVLGQLCRAYQIPQDFCRTIQCLDDTEIERIVMGISDDLNWRQPDKVENCVYNLKDRKRKLADLVQATWSA